jgi:hypothetical protein
MKQPSREILEALASLHNQSAGKLLVSWVQGSCEELTERALQSAEPRLCGGAFELRDLLHYLETAPYQLEKLKSK